MRTFEFVWYHSDDGVSTALITEGRKYLLCCRIASPIKIEKLNKDERRFMRPVPVEVCRPSKDPVRKTARIYLKSGDTLGITKSAKTFLRTCALRA